MTQQEILESLSDLFPNVIGGDDWTSLANLSQGSIAEAFGSMYDLKEEDLQADMFQKISPQMLAASQWKTYAPQVEYEGQSLLKDLYQGLGGTQATKAAGGFAGSGGFQKQQSSVRDVYGKSMVGALTKARQQQGMGLKGVQDIINQWHQAAQRIKGY
tara:strand:- start:9014 stop:9487 length:474 start_codon:yes stop_codon:yes gene_type:complete